MSGLNDPKTAVRMHFWLAVLWGVITVPAVVLIVAFRDNPLAQALTLAWVTAVSHYANAATHWGAWQASKTEVRQVAMEEGSNE